MTPRSYLMQAIAIRNNHPSHLFHDVIQHHSKPEVAGNVVIDVLRLKGALELILVFLFRTTTSHATPHSNEDHDRGIDVWLLRVACHEI